MKFISVLTIILFFELAESELYEKSLNWNKYTKDGEYSETLAKSDFGSVTGWQNDRAMISNGTLRITLRKNALSNHCGIVSNTKIPAASEYQLDFSVKFHSKFNWSRGGKIGFGLGVGDHNTGCRMPKDGEGGSLRLMWYNTKNRVYFIPYIYYADMTPKCGNNFTKTYPKTNSIEKGKWYRVHMYMKSNTGQNEDGHVQIKINNEILLNQKIRWTTQPNKRLIDNLSFHTFRGGSEEHWKSNTDDYIYYDNFSIKQMK
ncbi:hypothetical protein I4U23_016076 [Adineta vaga]|nr:hypothetical protein I4U23_016076 [Adineta vaga]